jgi:hypothetical protein
MSKMDGLRAMREARYERAMARAAKPGTAPATTTPRPAARPAAEAPPTPATPEPATDELCGHRSMNGRTCTRERGHAAKNHRYS